MTRWCFRSKPFLLQIANVRFLPSLRSTSTLRARPNLRKKSKMPRTSEWLRFKPYPRLLTGFLLLLMGCAPTQNEAPKKSASSSLVNTNGNDKGIDKNGDQKQHEPDRTKRGDFSGAEERRPHLLKETETKAPDDEFWEAISMKGSKIGYGRTRIYKREYQGKPSWFTRNDVDQTIRRLGTVVTQRVSIASWESENGELIECESSQEGAGDRKRTFCYLGQDGLQIRDWTGEHASARVAHPKGGLGGPFAQQIRMKQAPLHQGDVLEGEQWMAGFNQICPYRWTVGDVEEVVIGKETKSLNRIECVTTIGAEKLPSLVWSDAQGEIWKTELPGLGLVTERVSKEEALTQPKEIFDLNMRTLVKVDPKWINLELKKKIVYRATQKEGTLEGVFPRGPFQSVRVVDPRNVEITIREAILSNASNDEKANEDSTSEKDLQPNEWIQSDDDRVREMAHSVASSATKLELVKNLAELVDQRIQDKNFGTSFSSAAEVAKSLQGDCTEHAVLLAALCRARGLPARVAGGLVHFPQESAFAYHMWTETYIDGRWIPVDGTIGATRVGPSHIKIFHSNLDGESAMSAFAPMFRVLGQLQLKVIKAE